MNKFEIAIREWAHQNKCFSEKEKSFNEKSAITDDELIKYKVVKELDFHLSLD